MQKFSNIQTKQWIKAAISCITYILFIIWVGNYWWLLLLPFIADIFITKIIPWSFWKKIKNKTLYSICSWLDAIIFALIAVYFINTYLFQNYRIPSSSLEKSLMVGDFLLVSKASYGPRVPMTPLSFPLVQHTFPGTNLKSYIEKPHWEYKRLAGLDTIKALDIVVFNFPTGDTVATLQSNPDYYTLCEMFGRDNVLKHTETFGKIVYRPVDRRENYVKRCVGLPGDSLQIIDNHIFINGKAQYEPKGLQFNYFVATDGRKISEEQFDKLGISVDDRNVINQWNNGDAILEYLGYTRNSNGVFNPVYYLPLTKAALSATKKLPNVIDVKIEPNLFSHQVFPKTEKDWTRDNYGPIYIPRKGATISLNMDNLPIYQRAIVNYENNELQVKDSVIYINGEKSNTYTFKMNYFWMMGDNRHNSEDSRFWGFVPEDHIVGKPIFIWLSLDKDKSFINSIRWKRIFSLVENIR
ncbi:MAG: signal peptidase I [Bacteroidia bacterium]|nr:signal peptidase I [Bacteroidia bacterium]